MPNFCRSSHIFTLFASVHKTYVNSDFYPLLVIEICFDEQSMIVTEGQGSMMFTLTITNSVTTDVMISFTVITTNVTANSRLKV